MVDVMKKVSKGMDKLVKSSLKNKLEDVVEEIKDVLVAEYDEELVDVVTDRRSKTNPNYYRDDFINRLNKFTYITGTKDSVTISTPDMETFDFSGRLKVIEAIMEGMAGTYVEVDEGDYMKIYGKRPVNQDPIDEYVPPKERVYLVRYTGKIKQQERALKKKFVRYPFSNTPPIKILEVGDKYVDENMNRWIDEALKEAQKEFVRIYKGAKI